ncbi:MAG: hypothetical protein IT371_07345 [Deltaproteobacteria bacterium]|nr:hypothetical protein [Deltaproteobacteria bacterium]
MTSEGMNGQSSNGRAGYSGTSLLLMFAGGALAGAAVAYLAQADNRARVRSFVTRTRGKVGHFPQAVQEASHAAKEAFVEAYAGQGEEPKAVSAKHH